jgi:hypothetical protein
MPVDEKIGHTEENARKRDQKLRKGANREIRQAEGNADKKYKQK